MKILRTYRKEARLPQGHLPGGEVSHRARNALLIGVSNFSCLANLPSPLLAHPRSVLRLYVTSEVRKRQTEAEPHERAGDQPPPHAKKTIAYFHLSAGDGPVGEPLRLDPFGHNFVEPKG